MTCMQCKHITECKDDAFANDAKFCPNESAKYCTGFEPFTNADRIRAMSDEELAKMLNAFTAYFDECNRSVCEVDCKDCELCELCSLGENKALDWLEQPAKEG